MPSATVENYVKKILVLSLETSEGQVGMGEIAKGLEVAAGTATSMIKNFGTRQSWYATNRDKE